MKLKQLYSLLKEQVKTPLWEQSASNEIDPFEPIPYNDEHLMAPSEKGLVHAQAREQALQAIKTSLLNRAHYWEKMHNSRRSAISYLEYGPAPTRGDVQWGEYWFHPSNIKDPQMLKFLQNTSGLATKVQQDLKDAKRQVEKFKKQAKKDKEVRQAAAAATNPLLSAPSTGAIPLNKVPAKVSTGPRSNGVQNPCYGNKPIRNAYAGDPKSAPFTPQMKKLYLEVATALARNGKMLSVIYMGDNTFIAVTADGKFAWRKWGMMNKIYMNSNDMNTSEFVAKSVTQQDALLKKHGVV